jgi:uncharacterized protein YkwD
MTSGWKARILGLLIISGLLTTALAAPSFRSVAGAQETDCSWDPSWGIFRALWVTEVVALTNEHRAELGLGELTVSRSLTRAALWKAAHMGKYKYLEHDDPAPPISRTWDERIEDCGYSGRGSGENIAYGYRSPRAVFEGWLDSPGHRENIERAGYSTIGVGVATNPSGVTYWTQDFGTDDQSGEDVHNAPEPDDDAVTGNEDQPVTLDPMDNDFDADGDPLEIVEVTDPTHGEVTVSIGGRLVYTPEPDFFGDDSFTYTVMDVFGYEAEAGIDVSLLPVNDPPSVRGESRRVRAGRVITVAVLANDSDVDRDVLRLARIVSKPRHGQVLNMDREAGTITYRSKASAGGRRDRIVYKVTDGNGGSDKATLRFKIKEA